MRKKKTDRPCISAIRRRECLAQMFGVFFGAKFALHPNVVKAETESFPISESDPYSRYVLTSKDFQSVKQERVWCDRAFPSWTYMPWTYQWTIGYNDAAGDWSQGHGYNGAFLDGNGGTPDSPMGKLEWINRFGLRFYLDHAAGKGNLHLWDGGKQKPHLTELHGNGVRTVPVNAALEQKLRGILRDNIMKVKSSPFRAAYALDDEVSWGHFAHPTMWQVTDDESAYTKWLKQIYGMEATPLRSRWNTYEDIRPNLANWSVKDFNASPLMDQWSFNDSFWCNFLGDLVEYSNVLDPQTPCGIVGGQAPGPFGGYDYAKLMRKIQFIEAYNLGSSQAIIRSFSPHNAIPAVTSHFHQSAEDDIWQVWRYLALGNRGHIGWVENWFNDKSPLPWHDKVAPHCKEIATKIGPLMSGAEWRHDGIAIYYSHPSIQLGWIFDAEAHGKTWTNREGDHRLGSAPLVRQAWENMFRDSGLQTTYLSYADVVRKGVSKEYHTLILPACLCLSDAEAKAITTFCRNGGTVIADYLPGIWDQHGRGRVDGGALDALFGVRHDPEMKAGDVFGEKFWCETDQDVNYDWKTYVELLTKGNTCIKDKSGFHKAVRKMPIANVNRVGLGVATLMNLSPLWYNAYRTEGFVAAKRRDVFLKHLKSDVRRWVEIEGAQEAEFGYDITYFRKPDGRKILFVTGNPEIVGTEAGGGNASSLKTAATEITLKFATAIRNTRDERRGASLGDGMRFKFLWRQNEAIVLSFE